MREPNVTAERFLMGKFPILKTEENTVFARKTNNNMADPTLRIDLLKLLTEFQALLTAESIEEYKNKNSEVYYCLDENSDIISANPTPITNNF